MSLITSMRSAAEACSLRFDSQNNAAFGTFRGYSIILNPMGSYYWTFIRFSVLRADGITDKNLFLELIKQEKRLKIQSQVGNTYIFRYNMPAKEETAREEFGRVLNAIINVFQSNGYQNVCDCCKVEKVTSAAYISASFRLMCDECYAESAAKLADQAAEHQAKQENVVAGTVGALLGAMLGAAVIVVLYFAGLISALSGVIAAVCAVKGYELLAKKMSIKGAIISIVCIIIAVYVGDRITWGIEIAKAFETDFFTGFSAVDYLVQQGVITLKDYLLNLGELYLFAAGGAAPTIIASMKNYTTRFTAGKLDAR